MTACEPIPFFRPSIGEAERQAVDDVLRSGWLTTGERATEFERRFAEYVGAEHAVAVNSCTAALHLGLVTAGVGPGDEVIVPTLTFAATAEVVVQTGATPVLVDVCESDLTIDPILVDKAVTERTRAVMPVHYAGHACDLEAIAEIVGRHRDVSIVHDAAHALPTSSGGRRIGATPGTTCFSFYANKTITTGEGGMLTTADADVAARARHLALHGLSTGAWSRFRLRAPWQYDITEPGYKYNLTDVAAAMGLAQLARCDELCAQRHQIADLYDRLVAEVPHVDALDLADVSASARHLYVVRLDVEALRIDRDEVIRRLGDAQIGTSVHYRPLHLHSWYERTGDYPAEEFPVANDQFERVISLPIYPDLRADEVERVVTVLSDIIGDSLR